jgi:hypothetical protein
MIGLGPNGLQHGAVPYPRRPIRVAHTCESTLVFRERHQRHRKSTEQPPCSIFDADERQKGQVKSLLQEVDAQHFFKFSGGRLWPLSSGAARSARSRTTTESLRPSRPEIARVRSVYRSSSRPAPQMSTAHPLPHFHTHHLPTHSFVPYSADLCRASLSRKSASRVRLRNIDRLILVWLYRFFPSILNANRHNQAGNGNPLAPARLPSLLALEVSPARRTSED